MSYFQEIGSNEHIYQRVHQGLENNEGLETIAKDLHLVIASNLPEKVIGEKIVKKMIEELQESLRHADTIEVKQCIQAIEDCNQVLKELGEKCGIEAKLLEPKQEIDKTMHFAFDLDVSLFYGTVLNTPDFEKDFRFEGDGHASAIYLQGRFLNTFAKNGPKVAAIKKEVEFAGEILAGIGSCKFGREKTDALGRKIATKVQGLQVGECLLIPGGYVASEKEKSGHNMMYLVEKRGEDNYCFTIINTDEGQCSSYHIPAVIGEVSEEIEDFTHYFDFKLGDVKGTNLSGNFFAELMDFQVTGLSSVDPIYQLVKMSLKGTRVTPLDIENYGELGIRRMQNKEISAYKAFAGYLKERMGVKLYHKWKVHSQKEITKRVKIVREQYASEANAVKRSQALRIERMLKQGKIVAKKRKEKAAGSFSLGKSLLSATTLPFRMIAGAYRYIPKKK